MRTHFLITLLILTSSSLLYANESIHESYNNLNLSLAINSNQISIKQAYTMAFNNGKEDKDHSGDSYETPKSTKSPEVCFIIGFFPGFFACSDISAHKILKSFPGLVIKIL